MNGYVKRYIRKKVFSYSNLKVYENMFEDTMLYNFEESKSINEISESCFNEKYFEQSYKIINNIFGIEYKLFENKDFLVKINNICKRLCLDYNIDYDVTLLIYNIQRKLILVNENILENYEIMRYELYITLDPDCDLHSYIFYDGFASEFSHISLKKIIKKIIRLIKLHLDKQQQKFPQGTYDCVIAPTFGGIIVHESLGHTFENNTENLGDTVLNDNFILTDYAYKLNKHTLPVPMFYDDFGQKCENINLIKNGKIITDLYNSVLNDEDSGNMRVGWTKHQAQLRLKNTCILPGNSSVNDMIKDIKFGYFLLTPGVGIAKAGSFFEVEVIVALEIRKGKIMKTPLGKGFVLAKVKDFLENITDIGKELVWSGGLCLKNDDELAVGMGSPFIKGKLTFNETSVLDLVKTK